MGRERIAIYGAGGFAREVAWLLSALEREYEVVCFVEDGAASGRTLSGKPVLSWDAFAASRPAPTVTVAVGSPQSRRAMVDKCRAAGLSFVTLVHPSAQHSESVELGEGAVICSGTILTVNIKVGSHVHINLDCTVGHDARIGEFSTLAPGVHVSGHVHIGKDVYIGTGANIVNGQPDKPIVIGDGCVVAAGACITRSTEATGLYAGVPAELKKRY